MVRLFVFLLIVSLALFFGMSYMNTTGQALTIAGNPVQLPQPVTQILVGVSIAFFQMAIVIFALLDRIADTVKLIIKPFAVLLPLIGFLGTMYRTFTPVLASFLPNNLVSAMGVDASVNTASWVASSEFTMGLLITLGMMLLFLATYKALTAENAEIRALKAELAKAKRAR